LERLQEALGDQAHRAETVLAAAGAWLDAQVSAPVDQGVPDDGPPGGEVEAAPGPGEVRDS
jgi:hypothetical protein